MAENSDFKLSETLQDSVELPVQLYRPGEEDSVELQAHALYRQEDSSTVQRTFLNSFLTQRTHMSTAGPQP